MSVSNRFERRAEILPLPLRSHALIVPFIFVNIVHIYRVSIRVRVRFRVSVRHEVSIV